MKERTDNAPVSSAPPPSCQVAPDEPHRKAMLGEHPIYLLGSKPRIGTRFVSAPFEVPPARNTKTPLKPEDLTQGLVLVSTLPNIGKHACATQILNLEEAANASLPFSRLCHVSADAPEYWREVDAYHANLAAEGYSLFAASSATREAFGRAFGVLVHGHHRIAHGLFALYDGVFIAAQVPYHQMRPPRIEAFVAQVRRACAASAKAIVFAIVAMLFWPAGAIRAQHVDILLAREGGETAGQPERLVTGTYDFGSREARLPVRVFTGRFNLQDDEFVSADAPGFNGIAELPAPFRPLPADAPVWIAGVARHEWSKAISALPEAPLSRWNGSGEVSFAASPLGTRLTIALADAFGLAASLTISHDRVEGEALRFATTDHQGRFHQHLQFILQGGADSAMGVPGSAALPPSGIYAVPIVLRVGDLSLAEPILLLMNHGLSHAQLERAAKTLTTGSDPGLPTAPAMGNGGCAVARAPGASRRPIQEGAGLAVAGLAIVVLRLRRLRGWLLLASLAVLAATCAPGQGGPDGQGTVDAGSEDGTRWADAIADGPVADLPDSRPDAVDRAIDASDVNEAGAAGIDATDAAQEPCPMTYRAGHGDLFARYDEEAGRLSLHLRSHLVYPEPIGEPPLHAPETVCILVPYASYESIAARGGRPSVGEPDVFAPIGVAAGESFWILEANNRGPAQPFLGLSTEGVRRASVDGTIRFEFGPITTPAEGAFSLYTVQFLPRFYVSTSHPDRTVTGRAEVNLVAGGHEHFNWTFSRPGYYDVVLVASGRTASGTVLTSAPVRVRFSVEDT